MHLKRISQSIPAGLRPAAARPRALLQFIFGGASPRQKYFPRSERAIAGARTGNRALSKAPVIIGATRRGTLIGTKMAASHFRPEQSCFYLLHHVGLDDVAHVLVVELLYLDTALVAGGDFLDVVLEAAQ